MKLLTRYCAPRKVILPISQNCRNCPAPLEPQITPRPRPLRTRRITFSSRSNFRIQIMTSPNYFLGQRISHMVYKLIAYTHMDLQTLPWTRTPKLNFWICHQALSRARTAYYRTTTIHPLLISCQRFRRGNRVNKNIHQILRMTEAQPQNPSGPFASLQKMQPSKALVRRCHATWSAYTTTAWRMLCHVG